MATEYHEPSNGWPLGLEIMSLRVRVAESLHAAPAAEPYSLHIPSTSFSSFNSSNLDTESTASFFQDNSVSLGRLIGIRPSNGGGLYFTNTKHFEEREDISTRAVCSDVSKGHGVNMSQGICIPLLLGSLVRKSRSRSQSKPYV